jgi:hypothetical protein
MAFRSESRKIYEDAVLGPMYAYNDGMRAYLNANYLGAAFNFGLVYNQYPRFYLNDRTLFYIGSSLLDLGLCETADSLFRLGCTNHFRKDYQDLPLFGRIKVAIAKNNLDSLRAFITVFKQRYPENPLGNFVNMYDAVAHLRIADTAYAESLFLSLVKDKSDERINQASFIYMAAISLNQGNAKKTIGYLQEAKQKIQRMEQAAIKNLIYSKIYPVTLRDRTIVFNFCEDIDALCAVPNPSEQDQTNLLRFILDYPAPTDFKQEKSVLVARLGLDKMQASIDNRVKASSKGSVKDIIANIDSVCHQLDRIPGANLHN